MAGAVNIGKKARSSHVDIFFSSLVSFVQTVLESAESHQKGPPHDDPAFPESS